MFDSSIKNIQITLIYFLN